MSTFTEPWSIEEGTHMGKVDIFLEVPRAGLKRKIKGDLKVMPMSHSLRWERWWTCWDGSVLKRGGQSGSFCPYALYLIIGGSRGWGWTKISDT